MVDSVGSNDGLIVKLFAVVVINVTQLQLDDLKDAHRAGVWD